MKRRGKAQSESSSASADEDTDADAAAENDAAGAAQHDAAGPSNICNRACTRETDRQRRTCALASLRSSAAQPQTHPHCVPFRVWRFLCSSDLLAAIFSPWPEERGGSWLGWLHAQGHAQGHGGQGSGVWRCGQAPVAAPCRWSTALQLSLVCLQTRILDLGAGKATATRERTIRAPGTRKTRAPQKQPTSLRTRARIRVPARVPAPRPLCRLLPFPNR